MAAPNPLIRCCVTSFLLFLTLSCFQISKSQNITCNPDDLKALKSLYAGLRYEWTLDSSSSDCCDWLGVTCTSSRVTKLKLPGGSFSGKLTSSIGDLSELQTLNLSINNLHGPIPHSLFTLQKLEVIDLSRNSFSGQIPSSNISLPALVLLDLSNNQLTGYLPQGLGNYTLLQSLSLESNDLSGKVPVELFHLNMLTTLSLRDNKFTGFTDSAIGNSSRNMFSGSSIIRLDVSWNMLQGNMPEYFGKLSKLQLLLARSNEFTGPIPISVSSSSSIRVLNLRNNYFTGKIELNCSAMTSLALLDLGFNHFNDFVPSNLVYCPSLTSINLDGNNFSGGIPQSYKEFQALLRLSISNANLVNISGALEVLQNCKNLTTLVLSNNFFDEELPSNPGLQFEKLRVLVIAGCRLSGSAPSWLKESNNIEVLDLSWNKLNGIFPDWFGYFESLYYLDLSNNYFSGEIPKSLTGLRSWITGDISSETISPDFLFFFTKSPFDGSVYYQVWNFRPTLRLSYNYLTGQIYPEFGKLKKLRFLDLKHNTLSGQIPSNLTGMSSLESMDLSYNNLSGTIPSLDGLYFLSKFSVAYNNLHGKVPTGLETFPYSSFDGNPGLCTSKNSPCEDPFEQPHEENIYNEYDYDGFKHFAGIGFAIGFLFVIWFRILLHLCR